MDATDDDRHTQLGRALRPLREHGWTGAVWVRGPKDRGVVYLAQGRVVHAEDGRAHGEFAYWQLIGLPDVSVTLEGGAHPPVHSILRRLPVTAPGPVWRLEADVEEKAEEADELPDPREPDPRDEVPPREVPLREIRSARPLAGPRAASFASAAPTYLAPVDDEPRRRGWLGFAVLGLLAGVAFGTFQRDGVQRGVGAISGAAAAGAERTGELAAELPGRISTEIGRLSSGLERAPAVSVPAALAPAPASSDRPAQARIAAGTAAPEPTRWEAVQPGARAADPEPRAVDVAAANAPSLPAAAPLESSAPALPSGASAVPAAPLDVSELRGPGDAAPQLLLPASVEVPHSEGGFSPEIVVRVLVGEDGAVSNASVYGPRPSLAAFESAAVRAARGYRFRPALHGQKPVAVWLRLPIHVR